MNEQGLIQFAASLFQQQPTQRVLKGIGDDCSIIQPDTGIQEVVSTDTVVDGVHFQRRYTPAKAIGYKAVASALSDLAAMGAKPAEIYLSAGLPADFSDSDQRQLLQGVAEAAEQNRSVIAGGDTTASATLFLSVTVVGTIEAGGSAVERSGAKAGDIVGVAGTLGASGAGLALLTNGISGNKTLTERHFYPQPQTAIGEKLRHAGVHAMIDLSDGLAKDLVHVAQASGVAVTVDLNLLPVSQATADIAAQLGKKAWELAACGGEDYVLCFCVAKTKKAQIEQAIDVHWIGSVTNGPAEVSFLLNEEKQQLQGFEHQF